MQRDHRTETAPTEAAPGSVSRRLTNFSDLAGLFGQWEGEFHQLSRGPFEGSAHIGAGRMVRYFQAETTQAILTRGMGAGGHVSFLPVDTRNAGCMWQRRRLQPGQLVVKHPDVDYHQQTGRGSRVRCLLVPTSTLSDSIRALAGEEIGSARFSWDALRPTPETLGRFVRRLDQLFRMSMQEPGALRGPEGHLIESECVRILVEILLESWPVSADEHSRGNRSALVRRAVELMHDQMERSLTATEICEALGSSDRVLRRAFLETYGLGPMAYLRVMRMHAVRKELKEGRGSGATVRDIAGRWGFRRLGAFSAEFYRHFGERPSETLGVRGWPGVQSMVGFSPG